MSPFGMILIAFIILRVRRRRHWRMYRFAWQTPDGFPGRFDYYHGQQPVPPQPVPQPSAFEQLKARYVKGEIGDEQYESALDDLLKTPEGRGQIR
ncbi:MAG TPA: SHOCT domain-containing protein [Acidobacteriaceae bacterium]|nr:SHOCT domain-containing protein [Acidobacteriaceae bacterium]